LLPSFSVILGRLPATDLDSFFDHWQGANWQIVGEETMLGRHVHVVEVHSGDGSKSTFWVDPQFEFVLRHVREGGLQSFDGEVTELANNDKLSDDLFRFEPPPGSQEAGPASASSSSSLGPFGSPHVTAPEGFLTPAYIPNGLISSGGSSTSGAGDRITTYEVRFARTPWGPSELVVQQQYRAGGLAPSLRMGTPVIVAGSPGFRSTAGGEEAVTWSQGDVSITLRSAQLPFEELLRIAESMH
jgi:hypothetical protein